MKSQFIAAFVFGLLPAAQAGVPGVNRTVDLFDCTIDFRGGSEIAPVRVESQSIGVRETEGQGPLPGTASTFASFQSGLHLTALNGRKVDLQFRAGYRHVTRFENQTPVEAALWRCITLKYQSGDYREKIDCVAPDPDPFHSSGGNWVKAPIQEGVPMFSVKLWSLRVDLPEGEAIFSCRSRSSDVPPSSRRVF